MMMSCGGERERETAGVRIMDCFVQKPRTCPFLVNHSLQDLGTYGGTNITSDSSHHCVGKLE